MRGLFFFALAVVGVWRAGDNVVGAVELRSGRYDDLVMAVEPTMKKPDNVSAFVDSVTALMKEGSAVLWKATHQKLSFGSVRLVLPNSWFDDDSAEEPVYPGVQPARKEFSWNSADIRLLEEVQQGGSGRETRDVPYTLQAGQCGVPGRYVVLHSTLLDPDYAQKRFGPVGNVLVHEWAHYRWGVFDERGYVHDDIYPSSYAQDGEFQSSGCFAGSLEGDWQAFNQWCSVRNNECYLKPDPTSTPASVKSSLLHLPHLSEGHFCNSSTHMPSVSTQQNRLCGNRSIWEVLHKHPDFKNAEASDPAGVTVEVHRSPTPRIFLLFSTIPPEFSGDKTVTDSITKNIMSIRQKYKDTEIGMATFRASVTGIEIIKQRPLSTITENPEDDITAFLPDTMDYQNADVPLAEALLEIMPQVFNDVRGTLVLTWLWGPPQNGLDRSLATQLSYGKVKVFTLLRGFDIGDVPGLPEFVQRSGGSYKASPKSESLKTAQDKMFDRTVQHLQGANVKDHFMIGESVLSVTGYDVVNTPTLTLEGSTISNVFATMTFEPFDDEYIKLESLNSIGVPENMKEKAKKLSNGYFLDIALVDVQNADLEVYIGIKNEGRNPFKVNVIWTAEERQPGTNDLDVQVWSSEDIATKADMEENKNFIIYCKVTRDTGETIRDISLTMMVTDGTKATFVNMLDDGSGDPDLKRDDGIFSGTLYGKWGPGNFAVTQLYIGNRPDDDNINPIPAMSRSLQPEDPDFYLSPLMHVSSGHKHSGVQPINPFEGPCCGSFSNSNKKKHGVHRYFENVLVVDLTREIQSAPPRVMNLVLLNHNVGQDRINLEVRFDYSTPPEFFDRFIYRFDSNLTKLRDRFDEAEELTLIEQEYSRTSGTFTAQLTTSPIPLDPVYIAVAPMGSGSETSLRGAPSPAVLIEVIDTATTTSITSTSSVKTTTTTSDTMNEYTSTSEYTISTTETPGMNTPESTTHTPEVTTQGESGGTGGSGIASFSIALLLLCHFLLALSLKCSKLHM